MNVPDLNLSYTAEHRLLRVRLLMYLSAACLLLTAIPSLLLIKMLSSGTEPNGDPISAGEVVALLAICQLAGWSFLIGMHLYGRCYVVRIFASPDGPERVYETVGWIGRVQWFVGEDERQACRFHAGKTPGFYSVNTDVTVMAVDAPYYTQRIKSRRLPFVIDGQGTFIGG